MSSTAFALRNVELDGVRTDVFVKDGRIVTAKDTLGAATEIDGSGGALIPGLVDHHIHLFATAARLDSVDLSNTRSKADALALLQRASLEKPPGVWLRAVGFDDAVLGLLNRDDLDGLARPVRMQDRTGALWVLNSAALDVVSDASPPEGLERDSAGRPTGRLWRADAWLRRHAKTAPPSLAALSQALAARGVTHLTDASVTNGEEEARAFADARGSGALLQTLTLMSRSPLPESPHYEIGPLKILPDERDLPSVEAIAAEMRRARDQGRNIGVHCVTAAELVVTLAAFEDAGAQDGDRIEHGGIIPAAFFEQIRALDLIVVTQPNFIRDRGDRYLRDVTAEELDDLYRLASLQHAGIRVAAGSDAPYGGHDPWSAIATAMTRTTRDGALLGAEERISARAALDLYLAPPSNPGAAPPKLAIGGPADLCLLTQPLDEALRDPDHVQVAATFVRGALAYAR